MLLRFKVVCFSTFIGTESGNVNIPVKPGTVGAVSASVAFVLAVIVSVAVMITVKYESPSFYDMWTYKKRKC